jgi:deazaflavin-dependent oxidoreductase (nitroreductase family)
MLFGQEHVDRCRATDGEEGCRWQRGTAILLLTTRGRKSGAERVTPLIFERHGDCLVVASRGGTDAPPGWYVNLQAEPDVQVQVRGDVFRAHACDATPDEKPELWRKMVAVWPDCDECQKRTEREIPVVVLERAD